MENRVSALAIATILLGSSLATAQDGARPNIVVVLVDDLRWNGTGVTGHPFVETPSIDRLAREGVVFRNAFVTTPLCSPSRASFLTGRYARSHGVIRNGLHELELTTFPLLLEDSGYQTAFVGKWHMGTDDTPREGFTRWVGFSGQGNYREQELNIDGHAVTRPGHLTDVLNQYALEFVRDAATSGQPFMLYLSHKAVHEPFTPPPRHFELYADEPVPCTPGCDDTLVGKPALTRFVPDTTPPEPRRTGLPVENIREQMSLLVSVDSGLGDLERALTDTGVLDRTIVVFTSDNGYFHREHALADKRWPYEESIRIPFIVRYPPLAEAGTRNDALVLNIDLAPTLLELAGIPIPSAVDGKSLVPLLAGAGGSSRTSFVTEYFDEASFPRVPSWESIRTESLKFIRYPRLGRDFDELYDLMSDPYELENQIGNTEYSPQLETLERQLDRLLESIPDNSGR